ncbi:hypothetical protein OC498_03640 [Acinetobacter bohemicus]|uniref:Uncharacterized protein n=1 Tax=Acinetobacter lwoffii TaxID=28090 RepID=A0A9D2UQN6_ACILW|nr:MULTISPECIES: hypothetical protein [Acinetobacter]MDM1781494.1 hypothetical protein [Acinetobacter indicus]HJF27051.1 hypothetical protein [Acinetobacter lwoffii]MCO8041890.1 hypothetical protein [Acinetobacter sp. S4400-12]MCO8044678.1 hypothetical protein [Acinetobacter sp. S4397-1]MCU7224001.1 hypothetical protein [Acinetobacter bohemicus]
MKIVQEENLQQVEHRLGSRYDLDMMSCVFFALGMLICGFILHTFIF